MKQSHVRLSMGLVSLPAILLQDNLLGIGLQVLYVILLAITHGRRFRLLPNIILLFSVSSAHLLQPNGLHLFDVGGFPITLGALLLGARKALVLMALLYLSHYMVTGRPEFPGKLGRLISLQFYFFDKITSSWRSVTPKRPFIGAIDRMMGLLEQEEDPLPTAKTQEQATTSSVLINLGHAVILWVIFFLGAGNLLPTLA